MNSIVIIDDHDIVRYGLEMLVEGEPDLRIAGSAGSLRAGLELIAQIQPALVITDMGTGDSQGLDTVRQVIAAQSPRRVVVLSMQDEMLYGERVLALGAAAYVMKETAAAALLPACRAVLAGQTWVSPRLASRLLRKTLRHHPPAADEVDQLTARELEVIEQLRSGNTTKEIARRLQLSVRTVDFHRSNIKRKLGLRSGADLIAFASRRM